MRKICNVNGTNNSINFKKGQHMGIDDFLNCAPVLYIFHFYEIEGLSRYTK